ncbi:MAG: PEGA domain-containing protein [Myxococcales bacterium]|nr:PEGA domain-containing protein [Myxococcales bacterium]
MRRAGTWALVAVTAATALAAAGTDAAAQPAPTATIAVAPMTMLGAEDTSATGRQFEAKLASEISALGVAARVVTAADVVEATRKAKKPHLRACDGDAGCLAELGSLLGVSTVVFGEVGGLGDVQVLSLGAIDVASKKEQRRVRVSLGEASEGGVAGAVTRLLDPDKFLGDLQLKVSVDGASIYVDGKRLGKSPTPLVRLPVGPHALRITHPEHRDYVRFVDIGFGAATTVEVALEQFASVESSVESTDKPKPSGPITYVDKPARWYRTWWAVAGFAAVALGSAVAIGASIDGLDFETSGVVKPPQ